MGSVQKTRRRHNLFNPLSQNLILATRIEVRAHTGNYLFHVPAGKAGRLLTAGRAQRLGRGGKIRVIQLNYQPGSPLVGPGCGKRPGEFEKHEALPNWRNVRCYCAAFRPIHKALEPLFRTPVLDCLAVER